MTFMGYSGAEIIQLNTVESGTQETAFWDYPIILEQ